MLHEGVIPGGLKIEAAGERRVLLAFTTGRAIAKADGSFETLHIVGADLTFLQSGRAPLLANHTHDIDAVLGVIETAWLDEDAGALAAIARFGTSRRANEAWEAVEAGILQCVSVGYRFNAADVWDMGLGRYRVQRWRPFELSLVALPADIHAHVSKAETGMGELVALAKEKAAEAAQAATTRRKLTLRAAAWEGWVAGAAAELAASLGCDPPAVELHLAGLVSSHLAELTQD